MVVACPTCGGRGSRVSPEDACDTCDGEGRVQNRRKVAVQIPAGVHEGQAVRVSGEGEAGTSQGEPAGDLLCYIAVARHAVFSRHNADLVCQVPISFTVAAAGGTIDVPTLGEKPGRLGKEPYDVQPGTQPGEVAKLRGEGLPDLRGGRRGDLMVQFIIEIPKKLNDRQRELLLEFRETEDANHNAAAMPQRKGFLDRLRSMLAGDD
jgi:molecular chaperone DnaJ